MSGGVRNIRTPCFSCSSLSASAFCFCHFAHQITKVSAAIDFIISWCSGLSDFQTSPLITTSPMVTFSCIPGV
jgi:hypothetical protein